MTMTAQRVQPISEIVTNGGRVLGVTALGPTLQDAVTNTYAAVAKINWRGMQFRRDIAWRALPPK